MDVLVVVDEPLVREMATEWLEEAGLHVAAAVNAEVALTAVSVPSSGPPPILVTDVGRGSGGMSGITLAGELRRRWPGLGVVIMADHEAELARCGPLASQDRHLMKPFAPAALVQAVGELTVPATASER